jgi:hypothetical protein
MRAGSAVLWSESPCGFSLGPDNRHLTRHSVAVQHALHASYDFVGPQLGYTKILATSYGAANGLSTLIGLCIAVLIKTR